MRTKLQTVFLVALVACFCSSLVFGASLEISDNQIKVLQENTGLTQIPKMLLSRKSDKRNELPGITSVDLVTEALTENWVNDQWEKQSVTTYSYDANGNETHSTTRTWDGATWVEASRITQVFNSDNNVTSMVSEIFDADSGIWIAISENTFTYNSDGLLFEWITQMTEPMSGMIFFGVKLTMYYDATGFSTESLMESYNMMNGQWEKTERTVYTKISDTTFEEVGQIWDGANWVNEYKYETTLTGDSMPSEDIYSSWTGGDWDLVSKDIYSYDANGNNLGWITQVWDGSMWVNSDKNTFAYDAQGNEIEFLIYSWDGSDWQIESGYKAENFYENNNLVQQVNYFWENGGWVKRSRVTYSYNGATDVALDSQVRVPESYALSNYPNPFNPQTTIRFELPQAARANVAIFNVKGELIKTLADQQLSAGSHLLTWDGTNFNNQSVSSGVYLYRLSTENMSMTKRCMLLK